jgi:hypothetical protein
VTSIRSAKTHRFGTPRCDNEHKTGKGQQISVDGCLDEISLGRGLGGKLNRSILSGPVLGQPNPSKIFLVGQRKSNPEENAGEFFKVAIIIFMVRVRVGCTNRIKRLSVGINNWILTKDLSTNK